MSTTIEQLEQLRREALALRNLWLAWFRSGGWLLFGILWLISLAIALYGVWR